jgi:hypothetical protein
MSKAIDDYLAKLKAALAGADPATIQDAVSDAEEHLTTALEIAIEDDPGLSPEAAIDRITESYGRPEEVAAAYKEMEHMMPVTLEPLASPVAKSPARRFFGVLGDVHTYGALLYMLLSLITGIVYFTWATTGLSLSAGLIVLIIGLPFMAAFLVSTRGIALVEGRIIEGVLGVRMPRRPVFFRRDLGWWGGLKALFGDRTTWTALLYMVLQLPLGIIYFTVTTSLIAISLALFAVPVLTYVFGWPIVQGEHHMYFAPGWSMPLFVLGGILLLIATLHMARGLGKLHGRYAKKLLMKSER